MTQPYSSPSFDFKPLIRLVVVVALIIVARKIAIDYVIPWVHQPKEVHGEVVPGDDGKDAPKPSAPTVVTYSTGGNGVVVTGGSGAEPHTYIPSNLGASSVSWGYTRTMRKVTICTQVKNKLICREAYE